MKVLIIAPMLPQANGPGAMPMLLHAQLEALADRHEVTLIAGVGDEPWEAPAAREAACAAAHVHLVDRRRPQGARQRMRRRARLASDWVFTRRPWLTLWFAAPAIQAVIDRLVASCRFDLVVVEDSSMAMFRLPPAVPTILTDHEVGRPRPVRWRPSGETRLRDWVISGLDWRRWPAFQEAAWRRYDRVQVFTPSDARTITTLAPDVSDRVRVNPFGLGIPRHVAAGREEAGRVLFIGNFTHPPNRDAAVWLVREIMPRVRARHPQARLRLVGGAPPREVMRLAGPNVEVIADVPEVAPYLATAAVCVAPVRIGGGMRVKVLYALANGKAVVTTSLGAEGYAQPGRHLPMLVADDPDGIAAAIVRLLEDEPGRNRLERSAREFAEKFHSTHAWGARLDALYEEARSAARRGDSAP